MNFVKDIKKIDNTKIYFMIMLEEKKFTVFSFLYCKYFEYFSQKHYININYTIIKKSLTIICMWYNILCL